MRFAEVEDRKTGRQEDEKKRKWDKIRVGVVGNCYSGLLG